MPTPKAISLTGTEDLALLSEEMAMFLVRFGPYIAAGQNGISERTLRRLFERQGLRLAEHMKGSRRMFAERLLLTDLPITAVSHGLGFSSTQTFARFMRRKFGETATLVRQRWKARSQLSAAGGGSL